VEKVVGGGDGRVVLLVHVVVDDWCLRHDIDVSLLAICDATGC